MKAGSRAALSLKIAAVVTLAGNFAAGGAQAAPQWADYFMPTPIISPLSSTCWGAKQVGPRDQSNGLEDKTLANWNYWDGGIIKDEQTGIYHMFASRWNQADGHNGWQYDSHCVHATSNNLYGPYTDQGLCFTDNGGMCHNVNALKLKTGDTSGKKYAITCSGSVAGSGRAYGADSLDGPWTYIGDIRLDLNGYSGEYSTGDNFRTILRPDGQYECMNSRIGLADNVLGPYKAQMANNFVNMVPNSPTTNMEDPFIFYAGGAYHVIYHCWSTGVAYFYTSQDGITNWHLDPGPSSTTAAAYDPSTNMVHYTDGTVDHWPLLERASVYVENGHAVAMTFAAIDVQKEDDHGNDGNGSKVIVVPFDGQDFDSGSPPCSGTCGAGGTSSSGGSSGAGGATSTTSGSGGHMGSGGTGGVGTGGTGAGGTGADGSGADGGSPTGDVSGGGGKGGSGGTGPSSTGGTTGMSAGGGTGPAETGGTSSGSGGVAGAGGVTSVNSGGTPASGGHGSSGAAGGSGGVGLGGTPSGGNSGSGVTSQSSGCSCTTLLGQGQPAPSAVLLLLAFAILVLTRRQQ